MEEECITKRIKKKLNSYDDQHDGEKEVFLLGLMIEISAEISFHLENIVNKMYE